MKTAPDIRDLRKYALPAAAAAVLLGACALLAPSGVKSAFLSSLHSAFGSFGGSPVGMSDFQDPAPK